jgi:hypothetical protein
MPAGGVAQLVLVLRNDGDLASAITRLVDLFPPGWLVTSASVSKGLVSVETGQVRAGLGRLQPGEQVILTIVVQAPRRASRDPEHCITLDDGEQNLRQLCAPLPEVLTPGPAVAPLAARATAAAPGPRPTLLLLSDIAGTQEIGKLGASLLVGNEGSAALEQAALVVEMTGAWRLSDLSTTRGIVSAVDYSQGPQRAAIVRLGRLDPGALVAITLRGRPLGGESAPFCATLSSGDQPLQRVCDTLAPAAPVPQGVALR